jgi:DNA invertase Pin-like site-specific DNA recombinase
MNAPEATPVTPAVIYAAKSTADRHRSIDTQLQDGRDMATENGWQLVGEYNDEGFSAYSGNRGTGLAQAEAHAARAAAEHGTTCMLIAQAHDRFARGAGDAPGAPQSLGEIWHRMRRLDVHLRTVEDDEELRDEASVAAVGRRAHIDSKRKSKSVKKGMRRRQAKGMHNGGPRKFGFDYQRHSDGSTVKDAPLRLVPAEAAVVERIYRDYLAGVSQQAIQRVLNREGITTTRGKTWHQGTVSKLLADPFYAGLIADDDGTLHEGQHPPIISRETFERAAGIRAAGRKSFHAGGRPPARPYLFMNGHLRCGRCGGSMVPRTGTQKRGPDGTPWGQRYRVYQCLNRVRDVTACEQRPLPAEAIDQAALLALEARGVSVEQTRDEVYNALALELRAVELRLADADREHRRAADALARFDRDYAAGTLSSANYERLTVSFGEELAGADAARAQLAAHAEQLRDTAAAADEAIISNLAALREAIAAHLAAGSNADEVRFMLRRLFEHFTVRQTDAGVALVPTLRADAAETLADGTNRAGVRLTSDADGLPMALVVGAILVKPT